MKYNTEYVGPSCKQGILFKSYLRNPCIVQAILLERESDLKTNAIHFCDPIVA